MHSHLLQDLSYLFALYTKQIGYFIIYLLILFKQITLSSMIKNTAIAVICLLLATTTNAQEPTPVKEGEPAPVKEGEPTPVKEGEPAPVKEGEPAPTEPTKVDDAPPPADA